MSPAHHFPTHRLAAPAGAGAAEKDVLDLPVLAGQTMWRGNELGSARQEVVETGFASLDAELPGGGWPRRSLTEILQPQPSLCEWRLLGPGLKRMVATGGQILLVSPPKQPHLPGLMQHGLHASQLVWLNAATPAERLWTTEQVIKSNPAGAVLAWLPQARPEQLRRLQVHAQGCESPVFLFRPAATRFDASPAPLRLLANLATDWQLDLTVFKRRGPPQAQALRLFSIPDSLAAVLTRRLLRAEPDTGGLGKSATPHPVTPSSFSEEAPRAGTLGSPVHAPHPARLRVPVHVAPTTH